jgi:hypothetical protein
MGVLRKGVERLENRTRRNRMKKNEKKKRRPDKSGKDKTEVKLTIPSRRGRKKRG